MTDEHGPARLRRACARNGIDTLTARELEFAYAIAIDGRTFVAAGEALVVSQSTAEVHAAHITAKLGGTGREWRAKVARWYGQQEILDLAAARGFVQERALETAGALRP